MNIPVVLAFLALAFFTAQNLLLDQKLRGITPPALVLIGNLCIVFLAASTLACMSVVHKKIDWPEGAAEVNLNCWYGVFTFFGGLCVVAAYYRDGNPIVIMTILSMIPVSLMLCRYAWKGIQPSIWQVIACALAVVVMILVQIEPKSKKAISAEQTSTRSEDKIE